MHFMLTAHRNMGKPHSKCLRATESGWPQHWAARSRALSGLLAKLWTPPKADILLSQTVTTGLKERTRIHSSDERIWHALSTCFQALLPYLLIWLCRVSGGRSEFPLLRAGSWLRTDSPAVALGTGCSRAGGILAPRSGTRPTFPTLQGGFLTTHQGSPEVRLCWSLSTA